MNQQTWSAIDKELANGNPVMLSSPGHWWVVSAVRDGPNGKEYYAGATSSLRGVNNSVDGWTKPGAFNYKGAPDTAVFVHCNVDPNANFVRQMGLKPPATTPQNTRASLSPSLYQSPAQRATDRVADGMQRQSSQTDETGVPMGSSDSMNPTDRANQKPDFNQNETYDMRERIRFEAPQIQLTPDMSEEDRIR